MELNSKFRSSFYIDKVKESGSQSNIVKEGMKVKIRDEEKYLVEMYRKREEMRREIARIHTKNTRTYRRILKTLKIEANRVTSEHNKKYEKKIEHLRRKYKEEEREKIKKLPKGLEGFETLRVLDQDRYDEILQEHYEVLIIGDIELDEDEKNALKLPPKFSIMENLLKGGIEFDQETAFAKLRMEIQREIDEDLQEEGEEDDRPPEGESNGENEEEDESIRLRAEERNGKI